ncbi:MAG: hypothetical protein ACR2O6_07305 [Ilumatobacteraceae bacterium]
MNSDARTERTRPGGGWLKVMLDSAARQVSDRGLSPLARSPLGRIDPVVVSAASMVLSIWAAVAAWRGAPVLAVVLWLAGRIADGLGVSGARGSPETGRLAGLAAVVSRAVAYAAIPIGVAAGSGETSAWVAAAVLLATFHVDAASRGSLPHGVASERTARFERIAAIVLFALALAFPAAAITILWLTALAVVAAVLGRLRRATLAMS